MSLCSYVLLFTALAAAKPRYGISPYVLPVSLPINECMCFYCHLTLLVRNKLIHNGFKSVRCVQSIIHTPAYILHTSPRCHTTQTREEDFTA